MISHTALAHDTHEQRDTATACKMFTLIAWSLMAGSVIGAAVETLYMYATLGVIENRTGLVIGWASPIYGVAAVILTLLATAVEGRLAMFTVAAVLGGAVETLTSLWMEWAFNASAWDYSSEFLSLAGRTDFTHCVFWGAMGVVWAGSAVPVMRRLLGAFDVPKRRRRTFITFTAVCLAFYMLSAMLTVAALDRWDARAHGADADTSVSMLDRAFPDEYMERTFPSISLSTAEE